MPARMCTGEEMDWREMRAKLVAQERQQSAGDGAPVAEGGEGYVYESPLIEQGTILLGGTKQEFGFALRQQFFHKCVLLLLEGVGSCYIQDRGLSRWDSCAAQAVLEAHGGCFAKLSAFAAAAQEQGPPALASYRYVKGDTNADFEPGVPLLTPYNARGGAAPEPAADGTPPRATDAAQLKPYANTCGLIALPAGEMGSLAEYQRAVAAAAAKVAPAFD